MDRRQFSLKIGMVSAVIFSLLPTLSNGAQVTIAPDKDNTLYESGTGALSNGAGQYLFIGTTLNGAVRRSVLAFDVAGSIPPGATITDVTLTVRVSRTIAGPFDATLHRLITDWGEGTSNAPAQEGAGTTPGPGDATWLHTFYSSDFWTTAGGDFSPTVSAAQSIADIGFYTFGSTSQMVADVQVWLDNPNDNFGWLIFGNESVNTTAKRIDSRENPVESNRPVLTITYSTQGCCVDIRGNANGDGEENVNISDITYLVDYLFGIPLGPAPVCFDEGNANGDEQGNVNISDITYLVDYLFGIPLGPEPPACP